MVVYFFGSLKCLFVLAGSDTPSVVMLLSFCFFLLFCDDIFSDAFSFLPLSILLRTEDWKQISHCGDFNSHTFGRLSSILVQRNAITSQKDRDRQRQRASVVRVVTTLHCLLCCSCRDYHNERNGHSDALTGAESHRS